jgi:hypothetical protein
MILADPLASSRLQIELVMVESSASPSLRKSHLLLYTCPLGTKKYGPGDTRELT